MSRGAFYRWLCRVSLTDQIPASNRAACNSGHCRILRPDRSIEGISMAKRAHADKSAIRHTNQHHRACVVSAFIGLDALGYGVRDRTYVKNVRALSPCSRRSSMPSRTVRWCRPWLQAGTRQDLSRIAKAVDRWKQAGQNRIVLSRRAVEGAKIWASSTTGRCGG